MGSMGTEAAEFDQSGDDDGECGDGEWAKFREECGEEPVEGDGP